MYCVPLGTAYAHLAAVVRDRHRPQQVAPAAPAPHVRRVVGQLDRRSQVVGEHQQPLIVRAEQAGPALQALDVLARGPALPDAPRLLRRPAREAPPLHVPLQPRPARPVDDEVEALDARLAEHRPPRLIDGDVAQALLLQVRLERRLVQVGSFHGDVAPVSYPGGGFLIFYPEGVRYQSPGSRSAPRVDEYPQCPTPKGLHNGSAVHYTTPSG